MSRRMPPDPDLEDLFDKDPGLEPYANLLRSSPLKEPPLDPAFRSALRRRLLEEAWSRSERRPSLWASVFRGPGLAWAGASMAAVLLAIVVVQLANPRPPITEIGYLSSYPTGSVEADQPIVLSFNQPMDHQSVQASIHIEPATQVNYSWQDNQLTIVPVAGGGLAPNTQYHVTIAATATTAAGKPIGQPLAVAFNTQPPPSPVPVPNASPSPALGLAGERLVHAAATLVVGWSADGGTLFYVGHEGELGAIRPDGSSQRVLVADGVRMAALSPSGTQVAYSRNGVVALIGIDGTGAQVLAQADPMAIGWLGTRVEYAVGVELAAGPVASPAASASPGVIPTPQISLSPSPTPTKTPSPNTTPPATPTPSASPNSAPATLAVSLPLPATAVSFAPDGRRFIYRSGATTILGDGTTSTPWAVAAGSAVAWSPDSALVAFTAGGALQSAAPDGNRRKQLATLDSLGLGGVLTPDLSWSSTDQILVGSRVGLATIRPDGSGATPVRTLEYSLPAWGPTATRFAFLRAGDLWIADLSSASGAGTALADAGKVFDAFMQARLAGDGARAGTFLDSAGRRAYTDPGPALVTTTDPRPRRYYVISSQLLPGADAGVQFVVRQILARDANEVFSYDETVTLQRTTSGQLMVHAATARPRVAVGHGPSVLSVTVKGRQLVVSFDSDLAPETVAPAVKVSDPAGALVTVQGGYANRVLTITLPDLPPIKGYKLTIGKTLQDIDHQPLAAEFDYAFVAAAPTPTPTAGAAGG